MVRTSCRKQFVRFYNQMSKIQGRITISRYSKEVARKNTHFQRCWYLWITKLYSYVTLPEEEFGSEIHNSRKRYDYDLEKKVWPIQASSFRSVREPEYQPLQKFYIAVKELIIEWTDYQAEIAGYVHCEAREDLVDESEWFNRADGNENKYQSSNDCKQLLRFVKSPGLRTTNIKIVKEDLEFFPIQLNRCRVGSTTEEEKVSKVNGLKVLHVQRSHDLDCEIKPLFDFEQPLAKALPIKHAHITVEMYLQ